MDTKLTLKLDKNIIQKAKEYAAAHNYSLSRLIEAYLQSLTTDSVAEDIEISPFVKSISSGISLPQNLDYKKEYREHLIKKHS